MLAVKSLHIIAMVTWFAGLFYLPRLFVYHALAAPADRIGIERFKTMERKLYRGIMTPGAVLTGSNRSMAERFFAPCPRGLEAALCDELAQIGGSEITSTDGGVAFAGEISLALEANLESRLASRILWRVGGGAYRNEKDIYA